MLSTCIFLSVGSLIDLIFWKREKIRRKGDERSLQIFSHVYKQGWNQEPGTRIIRLVFVYVLLKVSLNIRDT